MFVVVFILVGVAACSYFIGGLIATDRTTQDYAAILFVVGILCTAGALLGMEAICSGSEYYLPCEIVATNETSTYFGTVDQDTQQIYAVETGDHIWPDDVPYLLHMDGKETRTVTDDEVLMVWRAD